MELKAARALADEHIAQLLGYLKSARLEHGLLINFGSYRFQIKKYVLSRTDAPRLSQRLGCLLFNFLAIFAFSRG